MKEDVIRCSKCGAVMVEMTGSPINLECSNRECRVMECKDPVPSNPPITLNPDLD